MTRRHVLPLAIAAVLITSAAPPTPAQPVGAPAPWRPDVSTIDADDTGVVRDGPVVRLDDAAPTVAGTAVRTGHLVLPPHTLDEPADTVAATVEGRVPEGAEVAVDVRGARDGGRWTEWAEARPDAPAVLPTEVRTVQVRLVLSATGRSPEVAGLALTPSAAGAPTRPAGAAALAFPVYATREGLVGGTTANGHVIAERDHFAALPSRRALATKDDGAYSVQVCAANGRCAWAPVWDVGPWNTKDDYWNPPDTREMWRDLPQGKPQAQAAHQDGYHGGKDETGREVTNPAGLDLADGTFWDGLRLTGSEWVTVTYLWTGGGPVAVVRTDGEPMNVRAAATTGADQVGLAANHAQVGVECQVTGEPVTGTQGTSDVWFRIAPGKFAAKANVAGVAEAPPC
ncbi:hypothetical protein [Saccharothrix australiensis]|uniref:Secreted protein n=1 Tax=Saccharothrix australiensis TaxID=2072 RepID=A0A495W9P0_9PSEU|nr:hypothetical protein [Saccharothrix australiensis]RKT57874.1 hypothetical protein C8E97_6606 [Saccharothrix australiensis]